LKKMTLGSEAEQQTYFLGSTLNYFKPSLGNTKIFL
jgi:hypothetical protein